MPKITEVNCETGEVTTRNETKEEIAIRTAAEQQIAQQDATKQAALEKLMALGLTEDEVQALLG